MSSTETRFDGFPMAVLVEGGLAVLAVLLAWLFGVSLREQFAPLGEPLAWAIARGLLAAVPIFVFFWWMVRSNLSALRQLKELVEWLIRETFPSPSVGQFAMVSLLAGVGEELLFRGVIQTLLIDWTIPVIGLVTTSVLFGLFHPLSALYVVITAAMGFWFGWLMLYYEDLVAPMVAHTVCDFVGLSYFSKSRPQGDEREAK